MLSYKINESEINDARPYLADSLEDNLTVYSSNHNSYDSSIRNYYVSSVNLLNSSSSDLFYNRAAFVKEKHAYAVSIDVNGVSGRDDSRVNLGSNVIITHRTGSTSKIRPESNLKYYIAVPTGTEITDKSKFDETVTSVDFNYNDTGYDFYWLKESRDYASKKQIRLTFNVNNATAFSKPLNGNQAEIPVYTGIVYDNLNIIEYGRENAAYLPSYASDGSDELDADKDGNRTNDYLTASSDNSGGVSSYSKKHTLLIPIPESLYIFDKSNKDSSTPAFATSEVERGSIVTIKPSVKNTTLATYSNVTVVTQLPRLNDKMFDGSKERGSMFTPTLAELVTPPAGWTVEYSTDDSIANTGAAMSNWTTNPGDLSSVTALRFKSAQGIAAGGSVDFDYKLTIPDDAPYGSTIYSSTGIAINGSTTNFLEGYRSAVSVVKKYGSVEVKYEDESGLEIKSKEIDMPDTTLVETPYDTDVDRKPARIEFNGKNYNFVKVKQGSDPTTGTVKEGVTTVTYVYKEGPLYRENTRFENGNITIKYVDENNVTLKEDVVKPEVLVNTVTEHIYDDRTEIASTTPSNNEYNIENAQDKPATIEFDGIVYSFDRVKDDESLTGKYVVGNKEITLIYTKPAQTRRTESGNVVIKYVDSEGNELKADVTKSSIVVNNIVEQPDGKGGSTLVSKTPTNARYDVDNSTDKPATLDKSNIRYTFAEVKDSTPLNDLYTVGTTTITLVYDKTPTETREEKGHVKVRYTDANDREIDTSVVKPEEVVNRVVEQPMVDGSKTTVSTTPTNATYDVNADKKNEIEFDNTLYRFNRVKDTQPTGTLAAGETVVTYVYEVVTGDVEVKYVDTDGREIKDKVVTHDDEPVKSDYDVNDRKDNEIEFDGKVYRYARTDGNPTGKVTEDTTTISYVYEVVTGDVEVKYVDADGREIKDKVVTHDDEPIKSDYDVTSSKENEIEFDGKVYRYARTDGNPTGKVTEDTTTISYVYEVVTGDVEVKYVDAEGHEIKGKVVTHDDAPIKSDYDVTARKENEIEFGGKVYRYSRTDGNTTGKVTEDTTTISYVYDVVTGDVEVKYESVDGVEIKSKVVTHDDAPIKSQYDVNSRKDNEIEFNGKVYRFSHVKDTQPTGEVTEDTTTVTYVYDVVTGDVEVKYVDAEGREIKDKVVTHDDEPIKSDYDVNDRKENEIEFDGKVYRYARTDGNPTGKVTEETTTVSYVYDVVTGDVEVKYVDAEGREIKDKVVTHDDAPIKSDYDVTARKENEIEFDGKVYRYNRTDGNPTGKVTEDTTTVSYVYEVVTGDVEVKYVDAEGREIKDKIIERDDAPIKSDYDVNNRLENEIEFNGKVYRHVRTDGNPTGKVTEDTTTISYIYEVVTGDVEVEYFESGGLYIKNTVVTHDDAPIKSDYDVSDRKENEIEFDGKVYRYSRTEGNPIGKVTEDTTTVRYVYDVVTGDVEVKYVDVDGNEIHDKVVAFDDAPIKSDYDVNDRKDNEIEFDGKVYRYVRTDGNTTGKVTEDTTTVTYVYEVIKGDVVIHYTDMNGNVIKDEFKQYDQEPVRSRYNVLANRLNDIDFNGKVYRYRETNGKPIGNIVEGVTHVTFKYNVVVGDVIVNYTDTAGVSIKESVVGVDDKPIKSLYDVTPLKENEIESGGKVYRYKSTTGDVIGKVTESPIEVTYVYDVVTGDVEVKYVDVEGREIKDKVVTHDNEPIKSDYDVNAQLENEIEFNGKVYRHSRTDGNPIGKITENTTTISYVYEIVTGDVEVKYVDAEGREIKDKVVTHDDEPIKSDYDVSDRKENEIEFDGKVYRYSRTDGNPTGKVTEDTTTVSYVYEVVTGDVEVKYVDAEGREIKDKVITHDDSPIKSDYDVTSSKENEIEFDGKVYRYSRTDGNTTGKVTEDTTTISYVYEIVTGDVEVKYVDAEGRDIKDKIVTHDDAPIKSDYDVTSSKDNEIEFDGKVYRYSRTDGNPTGKVTEDTTTVSYVYEIVTGDVEVKYVDVDGREIKDKITTHDDAPIKSDYDVNDRKDNEIEFDGKVYRYVRTDGNTTGKVTEDTTTVTYVYEVVTGDVEVKYVDINGVELKESMLIHDDSPIKSDYDVTSYKDNEIETNGTLYRYVRTDGEPTGKVVEDKTTINYVYDTVKGDVEVEFVDVNGSTIKDKIVASDDENVYTRYDVTPHFSNEIEFNGKVYRHVRTDGNQTGTVTEETTKVTYVYDVVKGDVEVKYVDIHGDTLKGTVIIEDSPIKSDYDVTSHKDNEIEANGTLYRYVRTDGEPTGKVTEDTTVVTYVYAVVTGDVEVEYVDTEGRHLKDKIIVSDDKPVNSTYDVTPHLDQEIEKDGRLYRFVRSNGNMTGKVTEGNTTISSIYELIKGSVNVKHVDIDGNELVDSELIVDNQPANSDYSVESSRRVSINKDGKKYQFTGKVTGEINGKVKEGLTTIVFEYGLVEVPNDYPTIEESDVNIKVPTDYPTVEKPEVNIKVPTDYPTVEKPEVNIKVPTDYPTVEKSEVNIKVPTDYPTVEKPEVNIKVPTDYPTVEKPEVNIKVPTDYPTVEKSEVNIKVPTDYPTIEKSEVNIKVPTDYPTIEKSEVNIKVPTDYPTVEKPDVNIKVPTDYPTVELPEGNAPVIPGIEVPEVPEKPQTSEVPVTTEKPQTPEQPVQATTTNVVESNGKQLPKTGDAGLSVTTLFAALSSIASGLFVGFRKKKDD